MVRGGLARSLSSAAAAINGKLRVAVVGAGPAGFYTARTICECLTPAGFHRLYGEGPSEAMRWHSDRVQSSVKKMESAEVDIIEMLPTPFGGNSRPLCCRPHYVLHPVAYYYPAVPTTGHATLAPHVPPRRGRSTPPMSPSSPRFACTLLPSPLLQILHASLPFINPRSLNFCQGWYATAWPRTMRRQRMCRQSSTR